MNTHLSVVLAGVVMNAGLNRGERKRRSHVQSLCSVPMQSH